VDSRVFPGAVMKEMILIRVPHSIDTELTSRDIDIDMSETSRITKLKEVCQAIKDINDIEELKEIYQEVE
jgi:hypothetical protein